MGTSTMSMPRSSYLCLLLLLLAVIVTHQSDVDSTPFTSMSANQNANGLMIPLSQQGDNPLHNNDPPAGSSALLDNNDLEQQNPLDYQSPWLLPPSWAAKHGCTPIRWALAVGVGVGVVIGSVLVWFFTSDKETSHAPATTLAPTTPAPTTPAPTNPPLCSENPPSPECIGWQEFFDTTCSGYCREDVGGSDCKRDDPCACTGNPKRLNGKITCQDGHLIKIDMNNAGLDGTIPEGISALTALTSLDMSEISNIRGGIPNSIGELTALTALGLNGKVKISGSIPNSIGALTALKILLLERAHISGSIPESFCALPSMQT